jgi:hypothetical protein
MAYLVRRRPERIEVRESVATPHGPRSRVLVAFAEPLTPDVLERAAARASRPFDRGRLLRRAHHLGIAVAPRSREPEARALLARLHRTDPLDPALAAVLREALARLPAAPVPETLADVADWLGASASERGRSLRELLDLYGRIADSRSIPRAPDREHFPHFSSLREAG